MTTPTRDQIVAHLAAVRDAFEKAFDEDQRRILENLVTGDSPIAELLGDEGAHANPFEMVMRTLESVVHIISHTHDPEVACDVIAGLYARLCCDDRAVDVIERRPDVYKWGVFAVDGGPHMVGDARDLSDSPPNLDEIRKAAESWES